MHNNFDELAKGLAQSATRRQALRKVGIGLAGMALGCFGLANKAKATTINGLCVAQNVSFTGKEWRLNRYCSGYSSTLGCVTTGSADCTAGEAVGSAKPGSCGYYVAASKKCLITL